MQISELGLTESSCFAACQQEKVMYISVIGEEHPLSETHFIKLGDYVVHFPLI